MSETAFYRICLEEELARRCEKNPRYSIRALARAFGVDPTALSRVLSGKKIPSKKLAEKFLKLLDLPPERESLFWASLALTHRTQPRERLSPFFKKMPVRAIPVRDLSGDWYRVVSDWYHYAILEMANLPAFNPDPSWIASQLGISPAESKLAIERLVRLDLLVRKDGKLSRSAGQMSTADQHLTNSALKRRQRQILEKSMASLENDPIETRNHTAMTMSIDPKRIPEAKALIREFNRRMSDLLESGDRTCVYEFAISLFPVLKNRGEV